MTTDLRAALPALLPLAIAWAQRESQRSLAVGRALDAGEVALARAVGVRASERIRIEVVAHMPLPDHEALRSAALQSGLLGPGGIGLTLGHAVLLLSPHHGDPRLLAHEFRHVQQYEAAGGIEAFLPTYLAEIVQYGYRSAPSEIDARAHERFAAIAKPRGEGNE